MFIVTYTLIWLACSLTICLLSFFVGRCARKLPVIDDGLPWALHRSHVPYATKGSLHGQADRPTCPPGPATAKHRPHASNVIAPASSQRNAPGGDQRRRFPDAARTHEQASGRAAWRERFAGEVDADSAGRKG